MKIGKTLCLCPRYWTLQAYFNTAERAGHRHSRLRETLPIEYTAPEQLHERLAVTTDIFAIAVVTYEMIFGRWVYRIIIAAKY